MFMESTIGSPTGFGRRGNDTDSEMGAVEDDPPERRSNVSVVDVDTFVGWCKVQEKAKGLKKTRRAKEQIHEPKVCPSEGPLPAPRISPQSY
jgi:hypothetical protein